jgi:hypothetical protein
MNQIMWQIPIIAITLTGGLWYAVSTQQSIALFRPPALFLAAVLDTALIIVLIRVRYVMQAHLEKLRQFYPAGFVEAAGKEEGASIFHQRMVVLCAFNTALGIAAFLSIAGGVYFLWESSVVLGVVALACIVGAIYFLRNTLKKSIGLRC